MPGSNLSSSTEPGSYGPPPKAEAATSPPQDSSFFVGPPLTTREKEAGEMKGDGAGAEEHTTPEIPQELEKVSRDVEAELKAAIEEFLSKGHAALKPNAKG
ncbi:hypothetical protein FA13DRAFT_1780487 [Coprinellus micaceus]|uniref:Uncharacterized protein n=1 Tax=Coprinellus micaceus TaxID=71717 RepID=A0A4Y7SDW3_COPMI|nr:hypothetical protein FA13DRAFT_1780487 [Coprinellus micaceus]